MAIVFTATGGCPLRNQLCEVLAAHTVDAPDFWDFAAVNSRSGGHAFFQYPAMMVPELQGQLLDDYLGVRPGKPLIYDPFNGSGTILVEAQYRGLPFYGSDINPIAVLLSEVKANPPRRAQAERALAAILTMVNSDLSGNVHVFRHRDKWFEPAVSLDLTRLRAAIMQLASPTVRRFMWIRLAETIRFVSNSRVTTFKLHTYSSEFMAERQLETLSTFEEVTSANIERAGQHARRLREGRGSERPTATVVCRDVNAKWTSNRLADVVMTSPPYGDNHTTIPYGQYSYLPMNWIDPADLAPSSSPSWFSSIGALDTASLGGSRAQLAVNDAAALARMSMSLGDFLADLDEEPQLQQKVVAFARDYGRSLKNISARLKPGGFSFWTLGERRVGGREMPLVATTREVLEGLGHVHATTLVRRLPSHKRMSAKNSLGATMLTEHILIMQKHGDR